jgi:tripartite-type tricarboxylate transporter receptor subunit TctC
MVPRGTQAAAVKRLHATFVGALNAPGVRERLTNQGFDVVGSSPAEFAAYVKNEIPKWAKVVKASGASAD